MEKIVRIAALAVALLVAACVGGPDYAPYDQGCAFNYRCPQNGGG